MEIIVPRVHLSGFCRPFVRLSSYLVRRGLSLVPLRHVAVLRRSEILPDMIDYLESLEGSSITDLPSSQVFVTGPSKTADIEGKLFTGVHGPAEVHIFLVTDA